MVTKPEDIPEAYWERQQQIARDEGMGNVALDDRLKESMTKELQDAQRTGIESWSNYLFHDNNPYPNWFKFYAWEGMSKLSTFNKQKKQFNKRSKGTVAPFPQLNPATLAKVYDSVSARFDGEPLDDEQVAKLVKSGNFNKLYSHLLLETKTVLPTPEHTEDVVGEWLEYTYDDVDAITKAAEGTPWCIAGQNMAESYTQDGGKFLLFHLQDAETNSTSPTAAASIRLDSDGRVAELSGLKDGQAIEDSLVPIVEEKVKDLPGGEDFLEALADKQALIAMDKKFQAGEDFTVEELRFLYEIDRPIKTLDTYNDDDPRVAEFKEGRLAEHFSTLKAESEEAGAELLDNADPDDIANNITELIERGAEIDVHELIANLEPYEIDLSLTQLIEAGAKIEQLVAGLTPDYIVDKLTELIEKGLEIDQLVAGLTPDHIANNLTELIKKGAKIDQLMDRLGSDYILDNFNELVAIGLEIDKLAAFLSQEPEDVLLSRSELLEAELNLKSVDQIIAGYEELDEDEGW